jgi:hypothetical protein
MLEIKDVESFKQVLLCRELLKMNQFGDTDKPNTENKIPEVPKNAEVIYNENGVKIYFIGQELGLMGPSLKFLVENNTNQILDIKLTNLYIDGFQAEYTGMYCNELAAGKKAYETMTLWENGCETFPSVIEFVVQIQNSTTWNTIVETKPMYLCLD